MPEEIGSLSIRLELDREEFDRDLQSLEGIDTGLAIAPKLNTDGISRQLQGLQGEVAVGLRLEKGQFEQQLRELGSQSGLSITVGVRLDDSGVLDQASTLKGQLEQQFGRVKLHLKPTVDDSALTKLNQHLDLKQRHFAQVRRDFRNPVKPAIDTSELDAAASQFQGLKQQIADLQNQAASVRFAADTSAVDAQISRLKSTSLKLTSTVEGGESSANETADVFAKAIAKALKKSNSKGIFGGLFEGIGAIASAPFKIIGGTISNVFTGVGLGIGEQISKELGQGLFSGIEDELSPLIGSFKLLGREAGSALTQEILSAIGEDGVLIQRVLGDLIGQEKILVESGASQSRSKKERNQNRVEATRFFAEERQENDVVAISKERRKLFVEQPAQVEEVREGLNRKVSRGVKKLDSSRIEKIDQGKLDQQSELIQKALEAESTKLVQLQKNLAQQRKAIAATEQKVADLRRVDDKSPEFQAARADLNAQKIAFAQAKKEELATTSNVSNLKEKFSELADQPKPLQTQIRNAAKRSAAESRKLEALQGSLSQQGGEIATAEQKVAKLQQSGDNSPELSKAEADLAVKRQRFAETQQDASIVASSVERYANKLTGLSDKLKSLEDLVASTFQDEFEKLERLNEQLLVNQRAFTKRGQILESAKVLGTIDDPESIDTKIAQKRARIQDLQDKKGTIATTSKGENAKIKQLQELKAKELEKPLEEPSVLSSKVAADVEQQLARTPEQVLAGKLEARSPQRNPAEVRGLDSVIRKFQTEQIQRRQLYKNLAAEIEVEEQQLRSLLAQKSTPLAKNVQAKQFRQELAQLIQAEQDLLKEADFALQTEDEDLARKLLAQKKKVIQDQAFVKRQLALLGEGVSGGSGGTLSTPASALASPTSTPVPAPPSSSSSPTSAPGAPDIYKQAVQRTAQELLGRNISEEQIPRLTATKSDKAAGLYNGSVNAISLRPQAVDLLNQKITKANLADLEQEIGVIVHETTHAAQFDFGQNDPYKTGINALGEKPELAPTPEEVKKLGSRIEGSTAGVSGKQRTKEQEEVSRRLEVQAYVAEDRLGPKIAKDLIKQKAADQLQGDIGIGGQKVKTTVAELFNDFNKVALEAKQLGLDISDDKKQIDAAFSRATEELRPLIAQVQNLEILPAEEILDLQEAFEKSVSNLTPIAGDIQALKAKIAGKATQAGITQPGAVGPTSGQTTASTFKNNLGIGAGKLKGDLEKAELAVVTSLDEMTELAKALGIDASQEIQDAIANINKAKADLEPLFDKAAQIDILPAEEIEALQEQIQTKTQAAIDLIEQQSDITGQKLNAKFEGSGGGGGEIATQETPEPTADPKELGDLLRQFGIRKLRPLAQELGIDTEGLKKGQIINRLTSEVDPRVLQPKVFELTRAKAQQQVARREQLGAIAEGTGSVAKKLLEAGQGIAGVLAPFKGAAGNAVRALGAVAKGGYKLAEASESLVLDIIPFGRTAKGIGQQFVLPAATFAAASHLPGGHLLAEGLTNVATGAISPLAHGAAGGAIDAATGFIGHAVPNAFGLQSHLAGAVSGGISSLADAATGVLGQAGAAVLGGKTITAIAGRGLNAAGSAAVNALAPGEDKKALPPAEPQTVALPQAQPKPVAIPLPDLKAETKGELVPVEEAKPIATTPKKSLVKAAQEKGAQAGEFVGKAVDTFETVKDATQVVVAKTQQAAGAIADTGKQALNLVRRINPEEALAEAEKLAANFRNSYKGLQDTLKAQAKALRKGDFSAAERLGRQAEELATNVVRLADQAQKDVTDLVSSLGDAASSTTKLGQQLNNRKSQISQAKNKAERVQRLGKVTDTAGVIDVSASSTGSDGDDSLAAFGDLNKIIEQQKKNLLELASKQLNDKAFVKDQIVNVGGFVGSKIGEQFGPVGELGGDIIGSLATRQALVLGEAGSNAFSAIKDTDEFKQAGKFQKLILLIQQLKKELQSPEIQKALGGELTGDIAGFVVGNLAGKLGTAGLQSLAGTVPGAGVLAAIPGKGALAAKIGVKPIVDARERFASNTESAPGEELAAFGDINLEIQKRYQRIAKTLNLSGSEPNLDAAEIQAKLQELDREIDLELSRRVSDRIDVLETEVALDDGSSAAPEVEAPELTDRRRRKQQALSPEQQQKFAALEIEVARDPNEDLTPDALVNAAKFDAAAERINNKANNTFERGEKLDPLASKPNSGGDRLKQVAGKELGEYGAALQKGIGQFGVDLARLPGFAQGIFAKLTEGPKVLNEAFKGLLGNVGNLVKGFLAFQALNFAQGLLSNFAKEALDAALKLDNLKTALNFASGSSAAGAGNLDFVRKTVDDLKVPLGAAQQGFKQLSAATRNTSTEGQATRDLFVGISQAATVLGLSTEESSGSLLALSQIASKGKVQAEELRGQLGERIPGAFGIAARAMGVTEAELNKLLETGQVTAEEFMPKFGKQLQSEFGGAAVNASKNAQSAMFDFGNAVLKVQESFGKGLQPFQVAGLNVAGAALKLIADRGDALVTIIGVAALAIGGPLVLSLAQAAIAANITSLGLMGVGFAAGKAAMAAGGFILQMAIAGSVVAILKNNFETLFGNTELGKEFKDLGDQVVSDLNKIRDAANEAKDAVGGVRPTKGRPQGDAIASEGLDVGQVVTLGLSSYKTDDFVKDFRNKVPFAKQIKGLSETLSGGNYSAFTTKGEILAQREQENFTRLAGGLGEKADQVIRSAQSGETTATLNEIADIDKQLKSKQVEKRRINGALKPDKTRLEEIAKEEAALGKRREALSAPLLAQQNTVTSGIQQTKTALDLVKQKYGEGSPEAKDLEFTLKNLEKAKGVLDRLQGATKTAVDPVRELASAFLKVQSALEEAGRSAEKTFQIKSLGIVQNQIKAFSTDVNAGRNAAVDRAKAERDKAAEAVAAEQTAFDTRKTELDKPGAQEALGEISIDGKPITVNSSIAEIDAAKKTLGDKDGRKKQILDDLKAFKESEGKLRESQIQLAQSDLNVKTTTEEATIAPIQNKARKNESEIQSDANRQLTAVKVAARERVLTEDQAAIKTAQIQERTTQKQIEEAQRQLGEYRAAKDAGKISAEQFAQRELELSDKVSQLRSQKEEQAAARVEATRRKRINELELVNRKAEADISFSATTQTTAIKSGILNGTTQEEAAIAQTGVEQDSTQKRVTLLKQQIAETKALKADGTLSSKEATEKELQLNQQLAESNRQLVDFQIQKQEQLRAAIAATFQRKREDLKLNSTLADNETQRSALGALQSGPVDVRGLELQTQGQTLGNRSQAIAQELTLVQQELAAIDALGQKDQAAADKKRGLAQQIADLQRQQIDTEKELFLNAREQEIRAIENRVAAQKRASEEAIAGIQSEKDANDLLLSSLDAQSKLLESRNGLNKALAEVGVAQDNSQLKGFDRALGLRSKLNDKKLDPTVRREAQRQLREEGFSPTGTELDILKRKQQLENDIASKKLTALLAEQEFQRRSLEIDLQRQKIAAQNLVFEAEIAQLRAKANRDEAQGNLDIAKKSGDSTKIAEAQSKLTLADKELNLSDRRFANAQSNLGLQDELAGNALQAQGAKQQAERINFNTDEESRESESGLSLAEAIGKRPRGGRRTFGPRSARSGGRSVPQSPQIRASEGIDPSIGRTSPQFPTSQPLNIPTASAPELSSKGGMGENLRTAVSGVEQRLDKIAQLLLKPRVENLYVSSPQPVSDAGSILSDIAYQGAVGAGLA